MLKTLIAITIFIFLVSVIFTPMVDRPATQGVQLKPVLLPTPVAIDPASAFISSPSPKAEQ
ncbi:MAG TPA: hypothetical protein DCX59_02235 [Candidatus Pacebacteria bacterium]|nr:hypothetical protein [Candidatus Paceibacterota bacterium]